MDKINNPFSPGAGSPPPELAGRDRVIDDAKTLLARVKAKRPEKSLLLTGLRGVGKTVLLNEIERLASAVGYKTILLEAHEGKPLATTLSPHLRRLLFTLDRISGAGDKVKRAMGVLKSFISSITLKVGDLDIGLDIDPELGSADSGDLEIDLANLLIAVAEAAEERGSAVAILIDEVQYFSAIELSALVMAMHKMQQRQLPLVLVGAGLPLLPALLGESKSYSERLFSFPDIGALPEADAIKAIQEPIRAAGAEIDGEALSEIYRLTRGYPYFLQEWGYQAWNNAQSSPITKADIDASTAIVSNRLDENFFRVRFDRLTPKEKAFMRAMAELGNGNVRLAEVCDKLGLRLNQTSPVRASLIKKGMIYSPAHGDLGFTVPLFDEFMKRVMPS